MLDKIRAILVQLQYRDTSIQHQMHKGLIKCNKDTLPVIAHNL